MTATKKTLATIVLAAHLAGAPLLLAACTSEVPIADPPGLGASVRHNMAQQIIQPVPVEPNPNPTGVSGRRVDGALERYHAGEVKQPVTGSFDPNARLPAAQ